MNFLTAAPVLLMTATIEAREGLPGRVLTDAGLRRRTYEENLSYWLRTNVGLRAVVFAENSGASLRSLEAVARTARCNTKTEVLSLPSEFPGEFGKGFGEALLIEDALREAQSLDGPVPVVKVTGLQTVANMKRLLSKCPGELRLMVDIRDHGIYRMLGVDASGWGCDTRCIMFEADFYRGHVSELRLNHKKGEFYIEDALYRAAKELQGEAGVYLRLPVEPAYRGIAGHWGKDYSSPTQRLKWLVRATVRRLAPRLWI